jgi:hypothetical protein
MSYQQSPPPSLLMRKGPHPNRPFPLGKDVIIIGRSPDNDIAIDDAEVSRHHARLTRRGNDWILEDLGSRNGTFVNGQRITGPVTLTPGAQVGLGTGILFSMEMGLPVAPAPPTYPPPPPYPRTYAPPRRKGRFGWLFFATPATILLILGVLAILGALGYFLYQRRQEQARAEFEPPHVLVTKPASGSSAFAGTYLPVSAAAFGRSPITRAELWVDGELKETQNSDRPEGVSTFYANFSLLMPSEGPHMLFVRAVNTAGIIGQSLPVGVFGGPKPGPGQFVYAVRVGTGETLAGIAGFYGTDPATLQKVNPNLKGQEPAAGSVITVPVPPEKGAPASSSPPPPAPPGSAPVPIPNTPPLKVIEPPLLGGGLQLGFLAVNPPAAPTGLQAQVKDCKVTLPWNDNATNEDHYEVRMAGLNMPPRVIAKLAPATGGPAWFEFPAPQPGLFSFWVEAVNPFGRQPSNIAWVLVDPKCPTTLATHLQVEALDMTVGGNYDRAYCYVSFESAPEARLPSDSNAFIKVQAGQGDIAAWASGMNKLVVPIPADGELEISGECWGWSGNKLNKLGSFSSKFATDTWDGARRLLEGGGFQIGIAIKPLGAMDTTGTRTTYNYEDPSIPAPYDVLEMEIRSPSGNVDPLTRLLTWKWYGDPNNITGFQIYLNGVPYNLGWLAEPPLVAPNARSEEVRLPHRCGDHIRWQVAAIAGEAQSRLSDPYEYDQPKCQLLARVKFQKIHLERTRDDGGQCDILESYFEIGVNGKYRCFGCPSCCSGAPPTLFDWLGLGECHYGEITSVYGLMCGDWRFDDLIGDADEITVPIDANNVDLQIHTQFWEDDGGKFGNHEVHLSYPSLEKAQEDLGCYKSFVSYLSPGDVALSQITYIVAVYPNKCREIPPAKGF